MSLSVIHIQFFHFFFGGRDKGFLNRAGSNMALSILKKKHYLGSDDNNSIESSIQLALTCI